MKFTENDLGWAVGKGLISEEQRTALTAAFRERAGTRAGLNFTNLLYYLGGLIIITSLTVYVGMNWQSLGGVGHLAVALVYGLSFLAAGHFFWHRTKWKIPGGMFITIAVCMIPLLIYSIQELSHWGGAPSPGTYRNFYTWIRAGWGLMEVGTIAGSLLALRFYRFPFLTMPLAFTLWYFSMDVTPVIFGMSYSSSQLSYASMIVGAIILFGAYAVDRRTRDDFAFWLYLFGLMAFWGGLTYMDSGSELGRFLYAMINFGLMVLSILLRRKAFLVFGALGMAIYIGHLAMEVFKDSISFTFALSGIGLLIILGGMVYHRNEARLTAWMDRSLPSGFRAFLPQYRK
ncbi:DUF2157 domain-containing protein [Pseudodesulfovibrio sp.]|uniref:DUF2157 domain-containing protein n=1 Tax=unclassified Pseudodesulfovibrio TaxID=2661612 RepID=UPI003B004993